MTAPPKYKHTRKEREALLRELKKIYRNNDEREFMRILRRYGIKDEDPEFSEIVQFFRALARGKA
jgi:hypothetical protein